MKRLCMKRLCMKEHEGEDEGGWGKGLHPRDAATRFDNEIDLYGHKRSSPQSCSRAFPFLSHAPLSLRGGACVCWVHLIPQTLFPVFSHDRA